MLRIQFGRGVAVSLPCLVSLCRLCRFDVDRCRPPPFAVVSLLLSFDDGLECYNLSAKVSVVSLTQKHEPMSFTTCAYSPWNRLTSHRTLSAAPFLCVRRLSRVRSVGTGRLDIFSVRFWCSRRYRRSATHVAHVVHCGTTELTLRLLRTRRCNGVTLLLRLLRFTRPLDGCFLRL
jgi:hypothetical protein